MTGPIIAKIDRADLGQAATRLGSKAGSPRHDRPRRSNGRAALAGLVALLALALPAAPTAWAQMPDGSATGDSPASPALPAQRRTWVFEARLDGKPIGDHRYVLTEQGDRRVLRSSARLEVKLLGLTVYRYSFEATEHWRGDCLLGLQADTLDDGTPLKVRASRAEGGTPAGPLRISGPKGELEAPGCVLSYAYWLPSALRSQKRLLNPQTGELEPVSVSPQGSEAVEAGPQRLSAQKLRISAPPGPIDLLTTPQGDWLGLDARVRGGRLLSYRLREAPGGASSGGARPVASLDAP